MYNHFKLASKFIRYYFTAANSKGHGVHSPFVFNFIKNVLNDKKDYKVYTEIEAVRKEMLNDKREITVEDFGAGSGKLKTNRRFVRDIAASSLKPQKFAQLIYRIVAYYKPTNIIELGTSLGITSAYLALAHEDVNLSTFEGSDSIAGIAGANLKKLGLNNIQLHTGDFAVTLPAFLKHSPNIDCAFIDGNHSLEPTLAYFNLLLNHTNKNSILIFDDIHWSPQMEQAWQLVIAHPAVTLSVDVFFIGIVFFRDDFKVKQHFTIRF